MKVELLEFTNSALELLIFTKNTRLQGEMTLLDIQKYPLEWKMEQLEYMKKTIQSSFEFVNYTFKISEVTRSFTHQLVRSRHNSYAQESMRAVDVRQHTYRDAVPDYTFPESGMRFDNAMEGIMEFYAEMIDNGIPIQDAREILPTGVHTSIIVGANLRSLSQMAEVRLCTRTAGEYQQVFKAMKAAVEEVHPWAEPFLQVACVKTGVCIFPNYKECPIQKWTVVISDREKDIIKRHWEQTNHVADPSIRK